MKAWAQGEHARRVVMLCYYYPPIQTAGIARSVGFARNLPAWGWMPVVVSVEHGHDSWGVAGRAAPVPLDVPVVRTPEINVDRPVSLGDAVLFRLGRLFGSQRASHLLRTLVAFPDTQIGWRVVARASELARDADCLYVSCSPFSAAIKAVEVKRRTGVPLVLDFRDAWSLNPYAALTSPLRHRRIARLERHVLTAADRVIVNTEGALRLYRQAYPELAARFVCIPNGYDSLNEPAPGERADDRFTVVHVGTLYGSRDPTPLLEAMSELDLPGARFIQVGLPRPDLERFSGRVDITSTGQVTPTEALAWMRRASLLYLVQGHESGVRDYIAVAAKTCEYLATGLPVLADCPSGDNADMVARHASRSWVITDRDPVSFREALVAAHAGRADFRPRIDPDFIRLFDRRTLTGRLAAVLEDAIHLPRSEVVSP